MKETAAKAPESRSSSASTDERPGPDDVRQRLLYRVGVWLANTPERLAGIVEWLRGGQRKGYSADAPAAGPPPEVRAALDGRYGSATRVTGGQRSVTFYSAVPIRHDGLVTGAVVVSQSTRRMLLGLYDIRLRPFEIVVASLLSAAFLTALAAKTIVGPLARLRRQATALAERRGPLPGGAFPGATRRDEIGALARALGELTRRTNDHIDLLQSFSADVSHELKNPLASIRTAAEMMADADSPEERRRFQDLMVRDVARLERLVSGLRDVARVEGQIEADVSEAIDLAALVSEQVRALNAIAPNGIHLELVTDGRAASVFASRERLSQVFENLLANAISFSPAGAGSPSRSRRGGWMVVTIEDAGPGIPKARLIAASRGLYLPPATPGASTSARPGDRETDRQGLRWTDRRGQPSARAPRFEVRLPAPASLTNPDVAAERLEVVVGSPDPMSPRMRRRFFDER